MWKNRGRLWGQGRPSVQGGAGLLLFLEDCMDSLFSLPPKTCHVWPSAQRPQSSSVTCTRSPQSLAWSAEDSKRILSLHCSSYCFILHTIDLLQSYMQKATHGLSLWTRRYLSALCPRLLKGRTDWGSQLEKMATVRGHGVPSSPLITSSGLK